MRANVWICDGCRINLASHHKCGALDLETPLPIANEKCCKRLLRDASHCALASIQCCRVGFQFSHRGMKWLPGFGKSWIGELDATDVRKLRRMRWLHQEHNRGPTRFHSKSESGSLRLYH